MSDADLITTLLTTARDETIERVIADPPLACRVLGRHAEEVDERHRRLRARRGFLGRLFGGTPPVPEVPALALVGGERRSVDLRDSWCTLNEVLAAVGDPLGPGIELADLCVGSGPVFAFHAREVHACHVALAAAHDTELFARVDPAARPPRFDATVTRDDVWLWLRDYLAAWRAFMERTSQDGMGMLMHYGP